LKFQKEHKTDLRLTKVSSFLSVVKVYVGLPSELSIPNSQFLKKAIFIRLTILITYLLEEFDDTKGVIRIRKLKKNRQHNGQQKKYKRTNNDLQSMHIKLKIE